MIRIRRAADAASQAAGKGFLPLLDLHSGRDPSPPACSYATHYPLCVVVQIIITIIIA